MVSDLSPWVVGGGGERVLWEQAARLAGRGHRVRIVSRSPAGGAPRTVDRCGVWIRHFPVGRRSPIGFLCGSILGARRAVAEELAAFGADVLHLYQPLSGAGALRSPGARGIGSLYTFLSPAPLEYRSRQGMTHHHRRGFAGRLGAMVLRALEAGCLRGVTRVHVLSDFSAGQLRTLYAVPAERIAKIPGGVDIEAFRPACDRRSVRTALGHPPGRPLLLTVRNLERRMGLDTLLRGVAALRRHFPEVLLLIGGEGSLRHHLESLAASLDLGDHVRFLGFIPEAKLPLYYQGADVFVLPTRELEGFGLVTVEALACGTPVMGTAVGATPEILGPLDPSLVFSGNTPEAMAEGLCRFLAMRQRDPAAEGRLRQACRHHAETRYAWDLCVDRLEALVDEVARGRDPRGTPGGPIHQGDGR